MLESHGRWRSFGGLLFFVFALILISAISLGFGVDCL